MRSFTFRFTIAIICMIRHFLFGAATPGFSSLNPAPNVPSWLALNQPSCFVRLVILALRILSDSSNKNRKLLKLFYNLNLQICAAPLSVRRTKIHGNKGCHAEGTDTLSLTEIRSIIRLKRQFTTPFATLTF